MTAVAVGVGNWVKQTITTVDNGTYSYVLGAAPEGYIEIIDVAASGESVYYTIIEGTTKECGIGVFTTGVGSYGTLTRSRAFETLVGTTHNREGATRLTSFTTSAFVHVSPTVQSLTSHIPVWKRVYSTIQNPVVTYAVVDLHNEVIVTGVETPCFPHTADHSTSVILPIGHDITGPTDVFICVHIASTHDDAATDIAWEFIYTKAAINEDFILESTLNLTGQEIAANSKNKHLVFKFAVPIEVTEPGTVIVGKLTRKTTVDTYAHDIHLIQVSGLYQAECIGTPSGTDNDFNSWY